MMDKMIKGAITKIKADLGKECSSLWLLGIQMAVQRQKLEDRAWRRLYQLANTVQGVEMSSQLTNWRASLQHIVNLI